MRPILHRAHVGTNLLPTFQFPPAACFSFNSLPTDLRFLTFCPPVTNSETKLSLARPRTPRLLRSTYRRRLSHTFLATHHLLRSIHKSYKLPSTVNNRQWKHTQITGREANAQSYAMIHADTHTHYCKAARIPNSV